MNLINQKLMKWNMISTVLLRIVKINTFKCLNRRVYDIKFTNMVSNEEDNPTFFISYMR